MGVDSAFVHWGSVCDIWYRVRYECFHSYHWCQLSVDLSVNSHLRNATLVFVDFISIVAVFGRFYILTCDACSE